MKPVDWPESKDAQGVTPHTGVWIETPASWLGKFARYVTPHTGVWIETMTIKP